MQQINPDPTVTPVGVRFDTPVPVANQEALAMAATIGAVRGQSAEASVRDTHPRVTVAAPRVDLASHGAPIPSKITIKQLDFSYGNTQALSGVSLNIPEKRVTCLIGPSGCGKSTLLRVLSRIYDDNPEQRAAGEVRVDGEDILGPHVDIGILRSRVGMVFQAATMFPMSVYDNVAFGAGVQDRLSRAEVDERVESALTGAVMWSEVKDRLSEPASGLSGGQQQRLCIARTLGTRPEVILLDEPTGALDPISAQAIEALILALKHRLTIVLVTHNMQQAARCADQVAFLYLGEMVEAGSTAQIFDSPRQPRTQDYIAGKFG